MLEQRLVKSKKRVKKFGEVFTPHRMVERMLNLVREDLESGPHFVDSTFLEPAAGDGNFLVAILRWKLRAVHKHCAPTDWPFESLFALASIYGIELLEDNHRDAQDAMLAEFLRFHDKSDVPCGPRTNLRRAAQFLIESNIVRGDTLAGRRPDGRDIEFSWWSRVEATRGLVHREPFTLTSLRSAGRLDFASYDEYAPCRIDHVHNEVRTHD